jgi:WD40 repeat protein
MWVQKLDTSVTGLAYSPDSKTLYSTTLGGKLQSWNIATRTGKMLRQDGIVQDPEPYGRGLRVLPDGTRLVVFAYYLSVLDAATGDGPYKMVPRDFPRYGRTLLTTDGQLLAVRADKRAIITWDVLNNQPGPVLREWPPGLGLIEFDLTPDGRTLAVLERRRHAAIIDLESGEVRCRFWPGVEKNSGWPLRLSADGNTLVVSTLTRVEVWDVSSNDAKRVAQLATARPDVPLAIHPTAPLCATVNWKRSLTLLSLQSGEPIRSFDVRFGDELMCTAFSPDGLTCAAGGSNGRFVVFDVDL